MSRLPVTQVSALVQALLRLRFVLLLATVVLVSRGTAQSSGISVVIVVVALATVVPLWFWHQLAPSMLRSPHWLALDLVTAVCIVAATSAEGPFLHFTLTTAVLSGLLRGRRGAVISSTALVAGYVVVLLLRPDPPGSPSFQTMVGAPALYPMAALTAAGVRRLLDRQTETKHALIRAHEQIAASRERARLARDMHDSLGKTLYGIALSATTVKEWAGRGDLARTRAELATLQQAVDVAAGEARALIGDLRYERTSGPLDEVISDYALAWTREAALDVRVDVDDSGPMGDSATYELLMIVKESLRNIAQHAQATTVTVRLRSHDGGLVLWIIDDGIGLRHPDDAKELADGGHYGLIGMKERAERIHGKLTVDSAPGCGVSIRVQVPASGSALSDVTGGGVEQLAAARQPDRAP